VSAQAAAPALTIAVPVWNGASRLREALHQIEEFAAGFPEPCELIVVDDGSRDETPEILRDFAAGRAWARVITHEQNRGKGAALKTAVAASRGELLLTLDGDASYTLDVLPDFLGALRRGHDAAIGNRRDRRTRFVLHPRDFAYVGRRHAIGGLYTWLARTIAGVDVHDCQAGFKTYRGDVARRLFPQVSADRFGFDVELLALLQFHGLRVIELPVTFLYKHQPSTVKLIRDGLSLLRRLFLVRIEFERRRRERRRDARSRPA
jgi:glycosyltransferase involved in cell wall biosynthesis